MSEKTYVPEGEVAPSSQIATTIEALAATIRARRDAGEESYTHQLLYGPADKPLKKVMEEAGEVGLAAKDVESELVMLRAMDHHARGHEALVAAAG